MDYADQAAEREAIHRAEALAKAQSYQRTGISRLFCLSCDDPIPEPRRVAVPGVQYCIQCQTEQDHAAV